MIVSAGYDDDDYCDPLGYVPPLIVVRLDRFVHCVQPCVERELLTASARLIATARYK